MVQWSSGCDWLKTAQQNSSADLWDEANSVCCPWENGTSPFLLGKKSSKSGNSQETLCSISWEVRFLTTPVSSPTGLCPQHLLQFRQAGTDWVHWLLTASPPWEMQPGDVQSSVGRQDRLPNTAALLQKHTNHISSSA